MVGAISFHAGRPYTLAKGAVDDQGDEQCHTKAQVRESGRGHGESVLALEYIRECREEDIRRAEDEGDVDRHDEQDG